MPCPTPRPPSWWLRWLGICLIAVLVSPAVSADTECREFFPDLSCDRQARPAGSVSPMSFPFLFEDPYITTGTNAIGLWQRFSSDSLFGRGDLALVALQTRIAITDRLAFLVTKDGFGLLDSDESLVRNGSGFLNVTTGFKYAVWTWEGVDQNAVLTPSLRYEIPLGQQSVYQGHDDGVLVPAVSAAYGQKGSHVVGSVGGQLGLDEDKTSSSVFYDVHVDHAFPLAPTGIRFIVPFVAVNGIHYVRSGDGSRKIDTKIGHVPLKTARSLLGVGPFEGSDLTNLGADGISGRDLVVMAWGLRLPVGEGLILGASYERPLSEHEDLWEQRLTLMITWEL